MTHWLVLALMMANVGDSLHDRWIVDPTWSWHHLSTTLSVESTDPAEQVTLLVPRPFSDDHQRTILASEASPRQRLWFDSNKLNTFDRVEIRPRRARAIEVAFDFHVATRSRRLDYRRVDNASLTSDESILRFSRPGPSTGAKADDLQDVALRLGASRDVLAIAWAAYEATIDRLTYEADGTFRGAEDAWLTRTGHCADYAAVFVALCRHAGLPARIVSGYQFLDGTAEPHVWAEFHLAEFGWVPCDPAAGDADEQTRAEKFAAIDANTIGVARDSDLDLQIPGLRSVAGVQEYLFCYEGDAPPKITCSVRGRVLKNPPPLPDGPAGNSNNNTIGPAWGKHTAASRINWMAGH